jgi:hypothetical protein
MKDYIDQLLNVFTNRRNELYQWALHNLVFGLAGFWLPFVLLRFFGKFRAMDAFGNQSLLMFSVTSCAISIGFFVKETQVKLRRAYTLTYAGLMITMLISVLGLTAIIMASAFVNTQPPVTLDMEFICILSVVTVLTAILLNFRLFMVEHNVPQPEAIERHFSQDADNLIEQGNAETTASGVIL